MARFTPNNMRDILRTRPRTNGLDNNSPVIQMAIASIIQKNFTLAEVLINYFNLFF